MLSNLRENYTYNIVQFNNQGFTLSDNPDSDYWPKDSPCVLLTNTADVYVHVQHCLKHV